MSTAPSPADIARRIEQRRAAEELPPVEGALFALADAPESRWLRLRRCWATRRSFRLESTW